MVLMGLRRHLFGAILLKPFQFLKERAALFPTMLGFCLASLASAPYPIVMVHVLTNVSFYEYLGVLSNRASIQAIVGRHRSIFSKPAMNLSGSPP